MKNGKRHDEELVFTTKKINITIYHESMILVPVYIKITQLFFITQ